MSKKISILIENSDDKLMSEVSDYIHEYNAKTDDSNTIIVPAADAFNLDPGSISLLVTYLENGGLDFLKFLMAKIFQLIEGRDADAFKVTLNGKEYTATSNILKSEFIELIKADLEDNEG